MMASRVLAMGVLVVSSMAACRNAPQDTTHTSTVTDMPNVVTSELQAGPRVAVPRHRNPYDGDARGIAEGRRLFAQMNCAGCHGAAGGGGIGPPFVDEEWIYGSEPQNIFQSVVQGRPNGMPAYGGRIPEDRLWMIVAYVRSLSPGGAPSNDGGPTGEESARR